jgi:hypothetical protein
VDLVHRAVDQTWGWFTVNQGRQWCTACRCAALPELWFTGPRRKGLGARGLRGELVLVVTGRREAVELAGIEGWWRRLLELVAVSTGVGRRGFGSGDRRGVEWLCSQGLYIGWSQGEKVVAVSMAGVCFFITLNVVVSRRGSDRVGISCGRGRVGDPSFLGTKAAAVGGGQPADDAGKAATALE